jgi:hypothetical protein
MFLEQQGIEHIVSLLPEADAPRSGTRWVNDNGLLAGQETAASFQQREL